MGVFVNPSMGVNEIYTNFIPALKNLYTVSISEDSAGLSFSENIEKKLILYQASSVQFGEESLELTRDNFTKKFKLASGSGEGSFKRSNTLTITWREDNNWSVKKFHEAWLGLFYDKEKDCYKSIDWRTGKREPFNNAASRYKNFTITLPFSGSAKNPQIEFINVLPQNTGGLDLAWGSSPSAVEYTLTYFVENWRWVESSDQINLGS